MYFMNVEAPIASDRYSTAELLDAGIGGWASSATNASPGSLRA